MASAAQAATRRARNRIRRDILLLLENMRTQTETGKENRDRRRDSTRKPPARRNARGKNLRASETKGEIRRGRMGVGGICPAASADDLRPVTPVRVNLCSTILRDSRGTPVVTKTRLGSRPRDR